MEKLTISKVGTEKEVQTKFGLKKKMGVQFNEYPDVWHDVWISGLRVGDVLEGTRSSREWEGKTYWDFKLPKKDDVTNTKLEQILNKLTGMSLTLEFIKEATLTEEKRRELNDRSRGYHYPTAEEEGISVNPEEVPF